MRDRLTRPTLLGGSRVRSPHLFEDEEDWANGILFAFNGAVITMI
jgi:hypothetical protein